MYKGIYNIAGKLRCQYPEVIGKYYEQYAEKKTVPVFPEKLIEGGKVFHAGAKLTE
jgi:hypothetical protein